MFKSELKAKRKNCSGSVQIKEEVENRASSNVGRSYVTNYGSITQPAASNNSSCSSCSTATRLMMINGEPKSGEREREHNCCCLTIEEGKQRQQKKRKNKFKAASGNDMSSGYETGKSSSDRADSFKKVFLADSNSASGSSSSIEKISITSTGGGSRENIIQANESDNNINNNNNNNNIDDDDNRDEESLLDKAAKKIPCLGILFALCASVFLGSAGMLVKMTVSVHGVQVAIFRALIQALIYGFIIILRKLPWLPELNELKPVAGRALLGALSITFSYYALKLIPLGDATTIRFSMPIWSLIVGYLILNETCSFLKILAVLSCISGVVLIAKPDFCLNILCLILDFVFNNKQQELSVTSSPAADKQYDIVNETLSIVESIHNIDGDFNETTINGAAAGGDIKFKQLEGSLLALSSSICLALSLVALRLCKKTPTEVIILWLSIASVTIGFCLLLSINGLDFPNNWLDVLYILLNGLCGSIGQWFITSALKIEQSGIISLARTADIQVAFLYSALLLHEPITMTSVVGSILVSCGVISVAIPKLLSSRVENNSTSSAGIGCCCCCFFSKRKTKVGQKKMKPTSENLNINEGSNEARQQQQLHSSGNGGQDNGALAVVECRMASKRKNAEANNSDNNSDNNNNNTNSTYGINNNKSNRFEQTGNGSESKKTGLPVVFTA